MGCLTDLTLAQARDGLQQGEFTSRELTQAYLAAMEKRRDLNAFITETPEKALIMADRSDLRRRHIRTVAKREDPESGAWVGTDLEGIPIAVKDLFCTQDVMTTAGSRILDGFIPRYESSVTAQLWRHGAVLLGKTSNDEFAMGSSNETAWQGSALNPWRRNGDDTPLVPGGSSGGSAAAVAARLALASIGTDTGGSIRQPASFCGLVGLKPTYGRCSRWGIVAFASSLDQAGPLTRDVRDCAIMLQAMAGFDPKDSTSADQPVPDYEAALNGDLRGLKVGIPVEYRIEGMDREIITLWERGMNWLRDAGAEIREVNLPHTQQGLPAYYIIAPAEASSNLARYDGVRYGLRVEGDSLEEMYANTRGEGFGFEVKRRILIGTYVLSQGYYEAYYRKAQQVRSLVAQDFAQAFAQVDLLLTPTTPTAAFALGARRADPIAMYLNDVLTVMANLAGIPGLSVPAGLNSVGLPLGLQLLGRHFDEAVLLRAGAVLEKAACFTARPS